MFTPEDIIIVAADGGGTGCRAAAGTLARGIIAEARGGPGNVHSDFDQALKNLTDATGRALTEAGLASTSLDQITAHMGVAGAHSPAEAQAVADALPYGQSSVSGDRATSVRGALGDTDGFVVALGTGTIVARQTDLQMQTVGGWGFHLSDHASGAWLGRRLLEETLLAEDGFSEHSQLSREALEACGGLVEIVHFAGTASPGDFAAHAPKVVMAAEAGDPLGRALMSEGAAYIQRALRVLEFAPGAPLVLSGGLGPRYAPYLAPPFSETITAPKGNALEGAFAMASAAARANR